MSKRTFAEHDVITINSGSELILIAPPSLLGPNTGKKLQALPKNAVQDATAVARMRQRLSSKGHSLPSLSDYDVLSVVNSDIQHGRLTAIALPRVSINNDNESDWLKVIQPIRLQIVEIWHVVEYRISVIFVRTAAQLPTAEARVLLSLLRPGNIAITVSTIALVACVAGTPEGAVIDAILAGIAYAYGGIVAIHALGDLFEFCTKLVTARSDQDLDDAADALARFIAAASVVLMAILIHKLAERMKQTTIGKKTVQVISIIQQRMTIARNFFRRSGLSELHLVEYMDAIDFEYPVEDIVVPPGKELYRLELPTGSPGSWYAEEARTTASQRGLDRRGIDDGADLWSYEDFFDRKGNRTASPVPRNPNSKGSYPITFRTNRHYVVNHPTRMLKSTARGIRDKFSVDRHLPPHKQIGGVPTEGGAIQYFSRDKESIR